MRAEDNVPDHPLLTHYYFSFMKLWGILFFLAPLLGSAYVFWRTWQLMPFCTLAKTVILLLMALAFMLIYVTFSGTIDKLPMWLATTVYHVSTSWLIILFYLFMVFLVLDVGRWVHLIPQSFTRHSVAGTLSVCGFMVGIFVYGYFNYLHKVRVTIDLKTEKQLERPLKMVMVSDLHLGYHNRRAELARWVNLMNAEKPDMILIGGDIIDRSMRPLLEERMHEEFKKLQAPVYACLGNHEYYSQYEDALQFYRDAGIHLLIDSVTLVNGIQVVGRDDRFNVHRKSLPELMQDVDGSRYTILLDHQPFHLDQAEKAGVDFQLSGHTHYGQVWPASWVEKGIYENAYGPLQKGKTQYFVTSGLGIWGGKFRIGTQSEYLVVTLTSTAAVNRGQHE